MSDFLPTDPTAPITDADTGQPDTATGTESESVVDLTPEAEPQPMTEAEHQAQIEADEAAAAAAAQAKADELAAVLNPELLEVTDDGTLLVIVGDEKVAQPFHDQIKVIDGVPYDMRFTPDPVLKAAQDAYEARLAGQE